jgi:hypothetical protein
MSWRNLALQSIQQTGGNMRRLLICSFVGSSLLLFSLAASAQTVPDQSRSPFFSQDQYQMTHAMFDKVRADLDRAQTNAYPDSVGSSPRFDMARTKLEQLERSWDQAQFNSRQIANIVSAMQTVLNDNRLVPHDSDELSADLSRLMEFQTAYY